MSIEVRGRGGDHAGVTGQLQARRGARGGRSFEMRFLALANDVNGTKCTTGVFDLGRMCVRLALNGGNVRLVKVSFSTFFPSSTNMTHLRPKADISGLYILTL